jgi:hypothetical protein
LALDVAEHGDDDRRGVRGASRQERERASRVPAIPPLAWLDEEGDHKPIDKAGESVVERRRDAKSGVSGYNALWQAKRRMRDPEVAIPGNHGRARFQGRGAHPHLFAVF